MINYPKKQLEHFNIPTYKTTISPHLEDKIKLTTYPILRVNSTRKYKVDEGFIPHKTIEIQRVKKDDPYEPKLKYQNINIKNDFLKLYGIDDYPVKIDKPRNQMTGDELFISRLQAEQGQPTILEATILAAESGSTPSEEFRNLAKKLSKTKSTGSVPPLTPPVVISPAFEKEDDDNEEDEKVKMKVFKSLDTEEEEDEETEEYKNKIRNILIRFSSEDEKNNVTKPELQLLMKQLNIKLPKKSTKNKASHQKAVETFFTGKVNRGLEGLEDTDEILFDVKRKLFDK